MHKKRKAGNRNALNAGAWRGKHGNAAKGEREGTSMLIARVVGRNGIVEAAWW